MNMHTQHTHTQKKSQCPFPLQLLPSPLLSCAEFKEQFKLCINRGHRGFRRAIQTKGIKFEVVHKG